MRSWFMEMFRGFDGADLCRANLDHASLPLSCGSCA
jgi:hypothetical protein